MSVQVKMGGEFVVPNHSQPECLKGWVVSTTLRPLYLRRYRVPTVGVGGWMGTENLVTTTIQSPDRQPVATGFYIT